MTQSVQAPQKILVVEDDAEIAKLIGIHLTDLGFQVDHAESGPAGLEMVRRGGYRLVVLDVMLPGLDGFEVCKQIRQDDRQIPILVLSAKTEEVDKVLGLELGADAYMTKPFSVRELVARIKAIFRRIEVDTEPQAPLPRQYRAGRVEVDTGRRQVRVDGEVVEVTNKEFDLLATFLQHPGRVFSRQDLLELVWGYEYAGYSHTVNSHINRLRRKIELNPSEPRLIQTVWGVGYRFGDDAG